MPTLPELLSYSRPVICWLMADCYEIEVMSLHVLFQSYAAALTIGGNEDMLWNTLWTAVQ